MIFARSGRTSGTAPRWPTPRPPKGRPSGYLPSVAAPSGPRKGMLLREADEIFGRAAATSERREGKLQIVTRTYSTEDGKLTAEFVEGVMIRYQVSSE